MKEFIKKAWKGEEKLWKVFWMYGVGGHIFFALLLACLLYIADPEVFAHIFFGESIASKTHSVENPKEKKDYSYVSATILVIGTLYFITAIIFIWNCAANTRSKFLSFLVRLIAVIYCAEMLPYFLFFWIGLFVRKPLII